VKGLMLCSFVTLASCAPIPSQTTQPVAIDQNNPMARNPFRAGQTWVLEGTKSTNKAAFQANVTISRVEKQSSSIDFVFADTNSGVAEITYQYSTFRQQIIVFAELKSRNAVEKTVCFFRGFVPEQKVNSGYAWSGENSAEFTTAYGNDDFTKFGECRFSKI
jgi:hypothetical protein